MRCMTKRNPADMATGIELSWLPVVFQDTLLTTKFLDLRYLWIAAICIAQGDRNKWLAEGVKMADVHSYSYVTVAASASASCDDSFLRISRNRRLREAVEVPGSNMLNLGAMVYARLSKSNLHTRCDFFNLPVGACVMDARAWFYQEALLSRRDLGFLRTGFILSCSGCLLCEDGDIVADWLLGPIKYAWRDELSPSRILTSLEVSLLWTKVLDSYVGRNITLQDARLLAIAGIVSRLNASTRPGTNNLLV